jgi:phage terminase large subunit-like protein
MLTNQSEYMAAGILGGVTGNRAGGLVIDDPYKGREDADSDLVRGSIQSAYEDDLLTRLYPGAWVCLIQTRWHEQDLAGKILPEDWKGESGMIECRDGQTWNVICLQAQCDVDEDPLGRKRGEYLWPEWFDERHWKTFKGKPRTWASLYQQLPSSQEGVYFKRDWFRRYRNPPRYVHNYISSDHAPGGTESNDYNVLHVWGMNHLGDIYLMERFHKQCTMDKVSEKLTLFIKRWDPLCWFPENDNNYKACAGFIKKEMLKALSFCRIEPITPHGNDKEVKAQPFQAMASLGRVWIPEGPEGDEVIDMFCKFPAGGKDDTDAAGTFGRAVEMAHEAIIPVPDPKVVEDRWAAAFDGDDGESSGDSWKTV